MTIWYKMNVRSLDSAKALGTLDELEHSAIAQRNTIGVATALFLKSQYYDVRLQNRPKASHYLRKAIDYSQQESLDYEWAVFTFQLGVLNYFGDNISKAIECLLRADDMFRQIGYEHDRFANTHLYHIGYVYYHLHNYRESLKYLNEASKYPIKYNDAWMQLQIPNTIGLAYRELGKFDSAFVYFDKALQIATSFDDKQWQGIASGNIGETFIKMKEYEKAMPYLEQNYALTKDSLNDAGLIGVNISILAAIADVYVARNNTSAALDKLNLALSLWRQVEDKEYWRQAYLFDVMSKAYALQNDLPNAYRYQLLSKKINDSIARRDDALRYVYVQQQLASEKHLAQIDVFKAKEKIAIQRRNFLLAALVLSGIIGWLVYNRYKLRVKKDLEIRDKRDQLLQSENLRIENELKNAQLLLDQYLESITEKNNLIENFREQMYADRPGAPEPQERQVEYLQQLSDSTLLTDEEWNKFRNLFEKVHRGFFVRLKEKAHDLTEADLRLLALTKLNISTRQMAQMLGISPSSIHTARYRLRKKLSFSEETFLAEA